MLTGLCNQEFEIPQVRVVNSLDSCVADCLQARNNMRAMKKGDLAFFYHSNTKVPGIAGIMKIVQEHSVDGMAVLPHKYRYTSNDT